MPSPGPRPRERKTLDTNALSADNAPIVASEGLDAGDADLDIEPDEWRGADQGFVPGHGRPRRLAGIELPRPFNAGAGVTIDLAAERDLMEAVSLGFFVQFALGWFWFVHAMARRQRMWGV